MAICRQLWVTVCSTFRENCMFLKPEVNSTCTRTLDRRWKGLITGHIVLLQKKVLGRIDGHQWLQAVFYNKIIPKPKMFEIDSVLQPLWAVAWLSHLDSAPPIGEVFYWASSSSPSRSPWVSDGETYSAVRADVVWAEQVAQVSGCLGLLMNWSNTRILTNLLSCKCCAKCLSWQHCFCPHWFHFSWSLLRAKPGFIAGRVTEAENAWCLMLCYFNFMIAASSVEWALIAGDTRWERH